MNKQLIIVNPGSTFSYKAVHFLKKNKIHFVISKNQKQIEPLLINKIKEGYNNFIMCGGDGSVNNFVNAYMKVPLKQRKNISLGILPCGKANDLVRELLLPLGIPLAYERLKMHKTKDLDIVKVNKKYFITGGGFGLPAEVVCDVNNFSKKFGFLNALIKDFIYYFFVLKRIFFGYHGVDIIKIDDYNYKRKFMLLSLQNQSFIGNRFRLFPNARNSDGIVDLCILPKAKNKFKDLSTVHKVINGKHIQSPDTITFSSNKFDIKSKQDTYFMADGELLDYSSNFKIRVIPRAIKILY